MSEPIVRPEIVEDEHLDFLDELRESGITNMFGAGRYIEETFGVDRYDAVEILTYWMKSYPRDSIDEN